MYFVSNFHLLQSSNNIGKLELWSKYILGDNTYLLLPTHVEDTPIKTQLADNESVIVGDL